MIRDQLEVQKWKLIRALSDAVQKEPQDRRGVIDLEVAGAVDKLEASCTARVQPLLLRDQGFERKRPRGPIERG